MAPAVAALTETVKRLPIEALAPAKQMLKRFFSSEAWTENDDMALADIVGTGSGIERLALDPELTLVWGWERERFFLRVTHDGPAPSPVAPDLPDLGLTFETDVSPEVTPSPRTIRFTTPRLHDGPSRFYNSSSEAASDAHVARLFDDFETVTNVLVGPDFVAVTISRPDQWERLLGPILRAVAEEFTGVGDDPGAPARSERPSPTAESDAEPLRSPRRLERAWAELGALRADRPGDLYRILAATLDAEPARRQVAAALLADAPPANAAEAWTRLFGDESRTVRRSVVDAVVDAVGDMTREELRPLLERALADADGWIRWKAVRGLDVLGVEPSRAALEARATDPDFRVRLEATRALG